MTARPIPQQPRPRPPRLFAMYRYEDPKQKSGTGLVAWGVIWPDGRCHTWWSASGVNVHQVTAWNNTDEINRVHGHGIRTRLITLGTAAAVEQFDTQPLRRLMQDYRDAAANSQPDSVTHLSIAMNICNLLPALLDAHDHLAAAYAQQTAALEAAAGEITRTQAENAAMQLHLDTLADTTNSREGAA